MPQRMKSPNSTVDLLDTSLHRISGFPSPHPQYPISQTQYFNFLLIRTLDPTTPKKSLQKIFISAITVKCLLILQRQEKEAKTRQMLRQNVSALLLAPIRIQVSVGLPLAKDIHNIGRKKKITQQQDWLFHSITISNLMLTTQNRAMILALKFDSDPSEINDKSLKYSFARLNLLRKFVSNFQIENRFCISLFNFCRA